MTKLWLDLETYSPVPIKNGTHAYAEQAEVLLVAWAIDDGPANVWDRLSGELMPNALWCALAADLQIEVWAHNSHFDRTVMSHAMGTVCPRVIYWRDTMVQALAHSLPGSLGALCEVLGVPADKAKDKRGKELIRLFCIPPAKNVKDRSRRGPATHPTEWAEFVEYARLDIEAMRECHRRMPVWNYPGKPGSRLQGARELDLWHLDQQINDRGVCIDLDLARGALAAVELAQAELAEQAQEMTDGAVQAATQRDAMLEFIAAEFGVLLDDLRGATVDKLLAACNDLDPALRELLLVRQQASTTSTAKYKTLTKATSTDGRLRGTLQFNGAARTGRWAGRLFQPQNIARGTVHGDLLALGIAAMKAGCADLVFGGAR